MPAAWAGDRFFQRFLDGDLPSLGCVFGNAFGRLVNDGISDALVAGLFGDFLFHIFYLFSRVLFVIFFVGEDEAAVGTDFCIGRHFGVAIGASDREFMAATGAEEVIFSDGGGAFRAKLLATGGTFLFAHGDIFATGRAFKSEVQAAMRADDVLFTDRLATFGAEQVKFSAAFGADRRVAIEQRATFRAKIFATVGAFIAAGRQSLATCRAHPFLVAH